MMAIFAATAFIFRGVILPFKNKYRHAVIRRNGTIKQPPPPRFHPHPSLAVVLVISSNARLPHFIPSPSAHHISVHEWQRKSSAVLVTSLDSAICTDCSRRRQAGRPSGKEHAREFCILGLDASTQSFPPLSRTAQSGF